MLRAAVFIPMPNLPIRSRLPNDIEPPNAVATLSTAGGMPPPLS